MEHKQTNSLDFCRTLLFTNRLGDRFSSWGQFGPTQPGGVALDCVNLGSM